MYDREHVAQSLGDEVMPGPYLEPCQVAQCSTHTLEADTVCWSNQLFHGSKMVTAFPAAVHGSIQVRTLEPIRAQTTVRHPCNFMPRSFEIAKITPVAASVIGRATYTAKPIRVDFHERCGGISVNFCLGNLQRGLSLRHGIAGAVSWWGHAAV